MSASTVFTAAHPPGKRAYEIADNINEMDGRFAR